ncbi:AMP-binding protein [Crossiella sp. CA198]|uniref:AMP-binding protein n=1 Tax=Crossiella sp. CA198 TaxID=3455607 RepID=UPI003F8D13C8
MIHRSPFPDVDIPDLPVHTYVLAGARDRGDHPAVIDGSRPDGPRLSYAQLDASVGRLAAGLHEAGLRKGDVLALFSPNTVVYPVVFYATTTLGAIVSTVNALYTVDELTSQLRDSGAKFLVTISLFLDRAVPAAQAAGIEHVIVCDSAEGHRSIQDLMATDGPVPEVEINPAEDVAVMPYSSGTTGKAKGVMLTHRNIVANMAQSSGMQPTGPDDRILAILPMFHIYGITVLLNHALHYGTTVVVLPRFELELFLTALAEHKVTKVPVAPPIVVALAKHPLVDKFDLTALRAVLCAAAPLDADTGHLCAERLGVRVVQGYGMTELSPVSHVVPDSDMNPPDGTVGKLIPNTECRIIDPATGEDAAAGGAGEFWIRGPQVMKGYFARGADTASMIDADGWLHTGDIGRVDEEGNFFIVDRLKELIKYKGYQVPPAELEAVLLSDPRIADAAVIGVRDAEGEEVPKAFVVRAAGQESLGEHDVLEYVAGKVAPYKKIRVVEFIDAVPRALSGKILRRELRQR